eukprot:700640-Rhodomonas_salina.3
MFSIPDRHDATQDPGTASKDRIITLKGFLDLLSSIGIIRATDTSNSAVTVTVKDATLAFRSVSTIVDGVSRAGHGTSGFELILRKLEDAIPALNQHVHIEPLSSIGDGAAQIPAQDSNEEISNHDVLPEPEQRTQPVRKTMPRKEHQVQSAIEMFKQVGHDVRNLECRPLAGSCSQDICEVWHAHGTCLSSYSNESRRR